MQLELQTLYAGDRHASHSLEPGSVEARKMTASSGLRWLGLLKPQSRIGLLQRTLLTSSAWGSMTSYLTWIGQGTRQRHSLYRLSASMRVTVEIDCLLFPTPAARDYRYPNKVPHKERRPGAQKSGQQLPNFLNGPVNPTWLEWLMGFPVGWTELEPLGTASSPGSPPSSDMQSSRQTLDETKHITCRHGPAD